MSFTPYGDESWTPSRDVAWAALVDDTHALTCNDAGSLVLWDTGDAAASPPVVKAVWRLKLASRAAIAMSPNRKTLAAAADDGLLLLDPLTGATRVVIGNAREMDDIDFTPDGARVIGVRGSLLTVWDLATGRSTGDIGLPTGTRADSITAVAPGFALLGGRFLFDLDRKAVVWEYAGAETGRAVVAAGRTWVVVKDHDRRALVSAKLPDPAAVAAAAKLPLGPLVKPGDTISLEVALDGTDAEKAAATAAIQKQLDRDGLHVTPGQPIKLVAKTENGETFTQTWRRLGAPPSGEKEASVNITQRITRIYYEDHGKIAWENRTVSVPMGIIRGPADKGIAETVTAQNKFNIGFISAVRIPTYVPQAGTDRGAGESRWTLAGVAVAK